MAEQRRLAGPRSSALPDDQFVDAITHTYLNNLDRMHAFARGRDAVFLAVLQPDIGHKPLPSEQETRILAQARWYADLRFPARYAAQQTAPAEFCRARGNPCLDVHAAPEFRSERETLFLDVVHLNERGHQLVSKLIEARLRELLPR